MEVAVRGWVLWSWAGWLCRCGKSSAARSMRRGARFPGAVSSALRDRRERGLSQGAPSLCAAGVRRGSQLRPCRGGLQGAPQELPRCLGGAPAPPSWPSRTSEGWRLRGWPQHCPRASTTLSGLSHGQAWARLPCRGSHCPCVSLPSRGALWAPPAHLSLASAPASLSLLGPASVRISRIHPWPPDLAPASKLPQSLWPPPGAGLGPGPSWGLASGPCLAGSPRLYLRPQQSLDSVWAVLPWGLPPSPAQRSAKAVTRGLAWGVLLQVSQPSPGDRLGQQSSAWDTCRGIGHLCLGLCPKASGGSPQCCPLCPGGHLCHLSHSYDSYSCW